MLTKAIQTERLTLREFEEADAGPVHEYCCDERLVYFLTWGPNTYEETRAFVLQAIAHQSTEPRRAFEYCTVLRDTGDVIGHSKLQIVHPKHRQAEVQLVINRHYWSKGYGSEALRALLVNAIQDLNVHRVYATVDPQDVASARLLERAGMQREGHLRERKWAKGMWRDALLYSLLDWELDAQLEQQPGDLSRHAVR